MNEAMKRTTNCKNYINSKNNNSNKENLNLKK